MLLTLYFMAATWMQSWRLQRVYAQLSRFVGQRTSIAFVAAAPATAAEPPTSTVGADDANGGGGDDADSIRRKSSSVIGDEDTADSKRTVTTSDLCTNASLARIVDVIWSADDRQGVALTPKQQLTLEPWIEFPAAPSLVPFDVGRGTFRWAGRGRIDETPKLYVLLETQVEPVRIKENSVLRIEDFGRPIAWKLDSRFAVLLETDLCGLAALVTRSFMQNNLVVNDYLPLVRVESVDITGEPQPFDSIRQHSRPELCARRATHLSTAQWQRHVQSMRDLNILASQASDFKYHRMRTEGKTGLSKPDLIPLASCAADTAAVSPLALTPPRRLSNDAPEKTQMRRPSPRVSPRTSPLRLIPETGEEVAAAVAAASAVPADTTDSVPPAKSAPSPIKPAPVPLESSAPVKASLTEPAPPKSFAQFPTPSPEKPTAVVAALVAEQPSQPPPAAVSVRSNGAPRPTLVRSKGSLLASKPPNVLVYSESAATRDAVIATLATLLADDMYTVYPLSAAEVRTSVWLDNTTMLVVCGSVAPDIGAVLTEFFLRGGKMLSLCSDVLHIVLPTFRTHAEVREHELVQFSYGRWQRVRMMHHIFCYQPSPVRKHFSTDSEESPASCGPASAASSRKPSSLVCPRSVEVDDMQQKTHTLQVQVLGTEETWNTPSLILATNASSGGKVVFSQVHLEADPISYEHDDAKFPVLRQSNAARMEIFSDLLGSQLGITVRSPEERSQATAGPKYTNGYFLGDYMVKFELLERLKTAMAEPKTLKMPQLTMRFCGHCEEPPTATATLLPIMINSCPENFSTVDYFENLKATKIGRLAIYVPVLTTTTNVLNGVQWAHGLTVIARQQTAASGRSKNQWLSPDGCLMFSLQLHVPLASPLGQRLSLLQHLVAVALVNAVLTIDGYEVLNIGLKWPNDIYANGRTKIGGLIVSSQIDAHSAVCNVGCGLNLANSSPTVCINDLIRDHNATPAGRQKPLAALGHERLLALCFTELERLFEAVQAGDLQQLYTLYDRLWLHSDAEVNILDAHGTRKTSKIIGIDEYGFLLVQRPGEPAESVHPDGNSFDMLRGLIVPKTH